MPNWLTLLLAGIACALLIIAAAGLVAGFIQSVRRFGRISTPAQEVKNVCCECSAFLTEDETHSVMYPCNDGIDEAEDGGGTAMIGDFCKDDCPGGCSKKRCKK